MSEEPGTADEPNVPVVVGAVSDGAYTLLIADFPDTSSAREAYDALKEVEGGAWRSRASSWSSASRTGRSRSRTLPTTRPGEASPGESSAARPSGSSSPVDSRQRRGAGGRRGGGRKDRAAPPPT